MQRHLKSILKKLPVEITRDKVHDALRLGLQSALAAAVTFLIMKTASLTEVFLAVLSAVLVVERSIGNSINNAQGRILSNVLGILIGFVFVSIIPFGYSTVISLVVTMFIMNAIASFKPSWRYGTVAAVAISLGSENDVLQMSLDRLIAIGIGIGVGLFMTTVIWPEKANKRVLKHLRDALNSACDRFQIAYNNSRSENKEGAEKVADNFHSSLGKAKADLASIRFEKKTKYEKLIDGTEKLYNSILIIHRVAKSSKTTLLNQGDEFIKDVEDLNEKTCEIVNYLNNKEIVNDGDMEAFGKLIERIKKNVLELDDDTEQDIFRHAFIFGIEEIHESLQLLIALLKSE